MNTAYPTEQLANKLTVVSHRLVDRASVAVGVWLKVGSRYESNRLSGISHFIEHLLFKGTPTRSAKKIKEDIEGRGGVLNAFTSEDTTCFFVKIVKEHYPLAIQILSDMVQQPLFDAEAVEKERAVIIEEIKMYMDMPMQYAHELIHQLLWPRQPLGRFVAGDSASMARISRHDIRTYHGTYYQPQNAFVVGCGDMPHEEFREYVAQYFPRASQRTIKACAPAVSRQRKPQATFFTKATEQSHLVVGVHGLPRTDPRRYALVLLHIILGANMSSRLYEEVREKRGLAYEIRTNVNFYEDAGAFTVSAGVENTKVDKTVAVIMRAFAKMVAKPVLDDELKRAQEYFINQCVFSLEDTLDHMMWLGDKALYFEDIPSREDIQRHVSAVTADDIRALARELFMTRKLNVVVIGPQNDKQKQRITQACAVE